MKRSSWSSTVLVASCVAACSGGGRSGADANYGGDDSSGADANHGGDGAPVIVYFTADPVNLPDGDGSSTLSWEVLGADSLSIDHDIGAVTGSSTTVNVTETTIFTLTATNDGGARQSVTAVVVGANPSARDNGRYVAMVSPTDGEDFHAPTTLRLVGIGHDPFIDINSPTAGHGGNASKVQFFVDDDVALEVDGLSEDADFYVFKGFIGGVGTGVHRVWARAIYLDPGDVLDSEPQLITVSAPPGYAQTIDLDGDVVMSGGTSYEVVGAANGRILLNGNGHRIVSDDGASGRLTLRFVDVVGLGSGIATGESGLDVTTTGNIVIEDSTFAESNPVHVAADGSATASIRRNVFRSNLRQPIGQGPGAPDSIGAVRLSGTSTATKVFSGNNIGAGWVGVEQTNHWMIGGDTDADSNVLIGPRVGIHLEESTDVTVRRNYSHHVYYGGWSQASNFELDEESSHLCEYNVISDGSWAVRGAAGEFRYNLVANAGHQWLWLDSGGASIHHNIFVGGRGDVGGLYMLYDPDVRVVNNTIDGQEEIWQAISLQVGTATVSSNAFINLVDQPAIAINDGVTANTDYNGFYNVTSGGYTDGRAPSHDKTGDDPMLVAPPQDEAIDIDEANVWKRMTTTRDALTLYRMRYSPLPGSPLLGAGDPAGGSSNFIGAIGNAQLPDDKFGILP